MVKKDKMVKYEEAAEQRTNLKGWVCKVCGRYWGADERMARWCCSTDQPCETEGCTNRKTKHYIYCEKCTARKNAERDAARFDKAELVEDYDGPFFIDDTFYWDMESYIEDLEQEDYEPQELAYVPSKFCITLNADDIWNQAVECAELEEGYDAVPNGWSEFQAAVEKFNQQNSEATFYEETYRKKFKLPLEYIQEELAEFAKETEEK